MSTPGLPPTPAAEAVVYGIPNCDTVKKARSWLAEHGVAYRFHDFKKQGVPADRLASWIAAAGWDKVLNRQGTTWRKLPADEQAAVRAQLEALISSHPALRGREALRFPYQTRAFVCARH